MEKIIKVPVDKYDFSNFDKEVNLQDFKRINLLINEALQRLSVITEYEVFDKIHNYGLGAYEAGTRNVFDVHLEQGICLISSTQKDITYPFAIFPISNLHAAAKYYV